MNNRLLDSKMSALSEQWKLTPATMAHHLNPNWVAAKHLLYISSKIAQAIARGNARIIISLPPRHGKSELITKYTSVWALEHFPHWNTILCTYGAELSKDFGRDVRDIIQANEDKLNVRIRQDTSAANRWKTENGGGMAAVGVGGAITGRGANILLIDDFIKELKDALNKAHKDALWEWWKAVARTRIEPGGSCIIVATRWAPDDLIGRILEQDKERGRWDYYRIPAIAEEDDLLGRSVGEALFRERYDEAALKELKDDMGSFFFNALFQQDPRADENALTNVAWLKIFDGIPDLTAAKKARIWDLAATADGGDFTVGLHMAHLRAMNHTYITNVIRRRLSPEGVLSLMRQTAIADGFDTDIYVEQEPGSSGKMTVEYIKNVILPEFNVIEVPAGDGKLIRAQPFLAGCEAGRVSLIKGAWNDDFIKEFGQYPGGDHDDQMDAASTGYSKLALRKTYSATWGRGNATASNNVTKTNLPGKRKAGIIFGRNNDEHSFLS